MKRILTLAVLLLSLSALTGCAFESHWTAAGKLPTPDMSIEGRWIGTWKSEPSGHGGGLRCIVTQSDAKTFHAEFKATYGWLFTYSYGMTMNIKASDGTTPPAVVYFFGKENLGWWAGGVYTYDGKATTTSFFCNYKSDSDQGVFQMSRPGGAAK